MRGDHNGGCWEEPGVSGCHLRITQPFKVFKLEMGETLTLGDSRVSQHFRHCVNEMKRPLPGDPKGRMKMATKDER